MGIYARETEVSPERSKMEIEHCLQRYGADQFVSGWDQRRAVIQFRMSSKIVRFYLPVPGLQDFYETEKGRHRTESAALVAQEQAVRQRWRALALAVKAKLEAVQSGITSFEQEFLAHIVLPNGKTMSEWAMPQLEAAYKNKSMPELLPGGSDGG